MLQVRLIPNARMLIALAAALCVAGAAAPVAAQEPGIESMLAEATVALRRDANQTRDIAEQVLAQAPTADQAFRAHLLLCDFHSERDQAATAAQIEAMEALRGQVNRRGLLAGLLSCRGESMEMRGANSAALALYDQAVTVAGNERDDEMLAGALYSRGFIHSMQGNYAQGLADLRRAQELYERIGFPLHALNALNGIASAYTRMGDNTQAYQIYARALETQQASGLLRDSVVTGHNMGRVSERVGNWRQAEAAYQAAHETSVSIAYPRGQAYALRGLAAVALARGDAGAALEQIQRVRALALDPIDARLGALTSLTEAMAMRALGRLSAARERLTDALGVFRDAGAQVEMVDVYEQLALVESELGDWRRAFQWQDAAKETSEQLLRNQIDQHFAALKVEFDTATREKEYDALLRESAANQQLLEQTRRARSLQYVVTGLIIVLAVLLATLAMHHNRNSRRMRTLALTDELTSVPNRRAVMSMLPAVLQADNHRTAAMLVDIDHFKRINDTFGHATGDRVLKLVAERLRQELRAPEFFGRIGGEEFLVVIPDTDLRLATARAEILRAQVGAIDIAVVAPELAMLTVSIGVTLSRPGDSTSSLLQRADAALYRAKASGRNKVVAETPADARLQATG